LLREQVALAWDKASGDDLPGAMIADLRLAAVHAARTSAEECRVLQDVAGGAGVPFSGPLGRRVRDAQTLTAHALVSPRLHRQLGDQLFVVSTVGAHG
jgi:alkylation response protein AidB-like acyl-CoA dehydrogenase